jgi:transcriptional regulator with XRE-family HTH domain
MTEPQLPAPLLLRSVARARGITQKEIARAVGVNQSRVSRLLSGDRLPNTSTAHKICAWVMRTPGSVRDADVLDNKELIDAVAFAWDGSPQHAAALAAVIRSLRVLWPRADSIKVEG